MAAALVLGVVCARAAFGVRTHLSRVAAPQRPVLFYNPKSGGGKAERFKVADEARARGIEPIELGPPWDLAELDLPYARVPAGTRNHFATMAFGPLTAILLTALRLRCSP